MPRAPSVIALTGATGFVGSNLLAALLESGYAVRALTRRPQSGAQASLTWIPGSLSDTESLRTLVDGADTLIHIAGLTKAVRRSDYFDVNCEQARTLFDVADAAGIKRVIHMSSMAAREPELSDYGASKAASDLVLKHGSYGFSWTALRPPAIYGPHEKEILQVIKVAGGKEGGGLLPAPAGRHAKAGYIHVADLSAAIIALIDGGHDREIIEIDDGEGGYTMADLASAIISDGGRMPTIIPLPRAITWTVGVVSDMVSRALGKPLMSSSGHMRYLSHKDWTVHPENRAQIKGWTPRFTLKTGMTDMLDWADDAGLL